MCLIGLGTLSWFLLASIPFVSSYLDGMFPSEDGHSRRIWPIYADYIFFDREEHFYLASIHYAVAFFNIAMLHIAIDCDYILTVGHTCGLLAVVR